MPNNLPPIPPLAFAEHRKRCCIRILSCLSTPQGGINFASLKIPGMVEMHKAILRT